MKPCEACEQPCDLLHWAGLCEGCYNKGIVWAAKAALQRERLDAAYGKIELTATVEEAWRNVASNMGIPGVTPANPIPNVLGSNAEQAVDDINEEPAADNPFFVGSKRQG